MSKPFSQPCENNKGPILSVIKRFFQTDEKVLEIASGTTQHVRFFSKELPTVIWQPSDIASNLMTVEAGLEGEERANILKPVVLDVQQESWPLSEADGVFSANSSHIMSFAAVADFFSGVGRVLNSGGYLCVYGPFKYSDEFTSQSNGDFDLWLKGRDARSGIRDFEKVDAFAKNAGLILIEDNPMPANNQLVVWQKT